MQILRRYMTQQAMTNTAVVLFFLLVLMLGGRLVRYFGIAAAGRLDVSFLFSIIGYSLPAFLELLLPLSFFVGLMLVFGRMYADSEMSVLNGSGLSRGGIARLMTPLILGMILLEGALTLWAKPWGVEQTNKIWQKQALTSALDLIKPQTFMTSQDYHLYVGGFDKQKRELQDLYLIQRKAQVNKNSPAGAGVTGAGIPASTPAVTTLQPTDTIVTAKRALQVSTSDDDPLTRLDLYDGTRYEIGTDGLAYNRVDFEQYRISLQKPATDKVTSDNIETQPTPKLLDNLDKPEARAELGYRVSMPWIMLLAAMLAVPLAQVSPRQGRWLRLLPAILIFASIAVAMISLKTAISKQKLPPLSYLWLLLGCLVFALYLNWQSRVTHRIRHRGRQRKLEQG